MSAMVGWMVPILEEEEEEEGMEMVRGVEEKCPTAGRVVVVPSCPESPRPKA